MFLTFTRYHVVLTLCTAMASAHAGAQTANRDTGADARRIGELRQRYVNAMRQKDSAGLGASVTETFVLGRQGLNPPNGKNPTVVGRTAFQMDFQTNVFSKLPEGVNPWVQYPMETDIAGDWALEIGDFGPDGGRHVARYIWLLHRDADGSWKIAYETFAKL